MGNFLYIRFVAMCEPPHRVSLLMNYVLMRDVY